MAEPTLDAQGELRFTPDSRALAWHATLPEEVGYDGAVRPSLTAMVFVDVWTRKQRIVAD